MSGRGVRALAAFVAGAAIGATAAGGTALLLYTGEGFIRAAGLLVSSTIMSLAAGVWAGAPASGAPGAPGASRSRGRGATRARRLRWAILVVVMLLGGVFTAAWAGSEPLRSLAVGGAVAVLLVLAMPAYSAGSLLAALGGDRSWRAGEDGTAVAAGALAGAAIGVTAATGMMIQTMAPSGIYYGAAALLGASALLDATTAATDPDSQGIDMTGHVTLITGVGGRGQLGYAIARAFLDAGATVDITDRASEVDDFQAELAEFGPVAAQRADLLVDEDVAALVAGVRERHGRLDSLINVAGGLTVQGRIDETAPDRWNAEIERNAGTVLRMCRAALPLLRESRGAIVNFTSPAADRAPSGLAAYAAAKAAVTALTHALAREEQAHGIRVNAVAPGIIDTQQNRDAAGDDGSGPDGGSASFVSRDAVADVVLFLAGRASRGVTGQVVRVPGPT